MKEFQI